MQQFAQQGGNTVVSITAAEQLTDAAANALLKTLEEPREHVYFLLSAPLTAHLLATVESRCQTWLVTAPSADVALPWLAAECPNTSADEQVLALQLCQCRPLLSKEWLETDRLTQRKAFLQTFWRFYKSHDVLLLLEAFDSEKPLVLQQLTWLGSFFQDSLKAKLGIIHGWHNADIAGGIAPFSQAFSAAALLKGYHIVQQTQRDITEINAVNVELMLVNGLTQLILHVFEQPNAQHTLINADLSQPL